MATVDLSTLTFTNQADIVTAQETDQIVNTNIANTLGGNDQIITSGSGITRGNGIDFNNGTIKTGDGKDTIIGTGIVSGINNRNSDSFLGGTIDTGNGSDVIIGKTFSPSVGAPSGTGISNNGIIKTGSGDDIINGIATGDNFSENNTIYGIRNVFGGSATVTIDTGNGNDTITGEAYDIGIINFNASDIDITINTGDGNDTITGKGGDIGIYNIGIIKTGNGNDIITGISTGEGVENPFLGRAGILNSGTIDTGAGNDIVDALTGGFSDAGTTKLGSGADTLKGFGSGFFEGGNGRDTLFFDTGSYTVSDNVNSDGFYTVNNGSTDMFIKDFEFISSASDPGTTFSFSSVVGETFMV